MEICLILHNIRSTYNVGAILRSAEGFGVSRVVCSGYTPWPYLERGVLRPEVLPHLAEKLTHQIHKSALGAEEMLEISWSSDVFSTISQLKNDGFRVVALENHAEIPTILTTDPSLASKLGEKVALILGEEVAGIPADLLRQADFGLEIPMFGQKESFNVSVAAGIALYVLSV